MRREQTADRTPQGSRQRPPPGLEGATQITMVQCALLGIALAGVVAADDPSTVVLSNGVVMPRVLLGMGPWCNDPVRCPAPAKPCHDCYNDTSAAADIKLALANGFAGVDTALGYVRLSVSLSRSPLCLARSRSRWSALIPRGSR